MAEALYNQLARQQGLDTFATSAGLMAYEGMPASMGAQMAMEKRGADLSLHTAKTVDAQKLADADLVLCMQENHRAALVARYPQYAGKIHTLLGYALGKEASVPDPFGGDEAVYDYCAGQILEAVRKILEK